ncbi:hypothetical protein N0B31_02760 [Salinirubellus salinus]|uniref:Uncharacterized protein n=1 Tax=Salinirubellus salinus TaxID=1364945 RepID=A0A9E7R418_9EURY|nr:hypothetical protein [Salinirubellus salinus]UWM55212.1 hypothetical protein N0B31_02760 [Salinirubellus salinus]
MTAEYRGPFEMVGASSAASTSTLASSMTTTATPAPTMGGQLGTTVNVESVPQSPVDAFFEQTSWKREDVELVLNGLSVVAVLVATYWKVSS